MAMLGSGLHGTSTPTGGSPTGKRERERSGSRQPGGQGFPVSSRERIHAFCTGKVASDALGQLDEHVDLTGLRRLGAGSLGDVILVRDKETSRELAVKVISAKRVRDVGASEDRIRREVQVMHELYHPNIVQLVDVLSSSSWIPHVDSEPPHLCILMEYVCESEPLSRVIRVRGQAPEQRSELTSKVILQLACALCLMHHRGLVHRDVWSENVLLDRQGRVVLVDLGCAEYYRTETSVPSKLNIPYMSPQAAQGLRQQPGDDCWAVGLLITELVTGRFVSDRLGRTNVPIHCRQTELNQAISETVAMGGPQLGRLCMQLLELDAGKRLSMADVVHEYTNGSLLDGALPMQLDQSHLDGASPRTSASTPARPPTPGNSGRSGGTGRSGNTPGLDRDTDHSLTRMSSVASTGLSSSQVPSPRLSAMCSSRIMRTANEQGGEVSSGPPPAPPAAPSIGRPPPDSGTKQKSDRASGAAGVRGSFQRSLSEVCMMPLGSASTPAGVSSKTHGATSEPGSQEILEETAQVSRNSLPKDWGSMQRSQSEVAMPSSPGDGNASNGPQNFTVGQRVRYASRSHPAWYPATVVGRPTERNSWLIQLQNGAIKEVEDSEAWRITPAAPTGPARDERGGQAGAREAWAGSNTNSVAGSASASNAASTSASTAASQSSEPALGQPPPAPRLRIPTPKQRYPSKGMSPSPDPGGGMRSHYPNKGGVSQSPEPGGRMRNRNTSKGTSPEPGGGIRNSTPPLGQAAGMPVSSTPGSTPPTAPPGSTSAGLAAGHSPPPPGASGANSPSALRAQVPRRVTRAASRSTTPQGLGYTTTVEWPPQPPERGRLGPRERSGTPVHGPPRMAAASPVGGSPAPRPTVISANAAPPAPGRDVNRRQQGGAGSRFGMPPRLRQQEADAAVGPGRSHSAGPSPS